MAGLDKITNKMAGAVGGRAKRLGDGARRNWGNSTWGQQAKLSMEGAQHDLMMKNVNKRLHDLDAKKQKNGKLSQRETRERANLIGRIERDRRENEAAYRESEFGNMEQGADWDHGIKGLFEDGSSFLMRDKRGNIIRDEKGVGKLDSDKAIAALNSLAKSGDKTAAFARLSRTAEFQQAMQSDISLRNRVADTMAQAGGKTNQAIATQLRRGQNFSFDDMVSGANGDSLGQDIRDMGTNIADGISKYDMKKLDIGGGATFDLGDHIDEEQAGALMSAGLTGDVETELDNMIGRMDGTKVAAGLAEIGADRLSGVSSKIARTAESRITQDNIVDALNNHTRNTILGDENGQYIGKLSGYLGQRFDNYKKGGPSPSGGGAGGPSGPSGGNPFNGQSGTA
jgi:hypothetical protein